MLTADAYRDGANESARQTASIVQTAMLAAEADLGGRALGAYADTTVSNAETDARSVQTTFDSRQPPDAASLDLRGKIHGPLDAAVDGLEALRIALRRGDERAVRAELVRLSTVGDQLSRIEQETEA